MSVPVAPAEPHTDPGHHAAAVRARCQALDSLVNYGTDFARLLHGQATALAAQPPAVPAQPAPAQSIGAQPITPLPTTAQQTAAQPAPATASSAVIALANAFDKIARTVRRCVLLAQRLEEPPKPARDPAPDPAQERTAARRRVIREVEDSIFRAANEGDRAETLNTELGDRLDDLNFDRDLITRPIADVIAELRRDLGLDAPPGTRPWKRRTPADIADLYARAAAPSSPRSPGATQNVRHGNPTKHPAASPPSANPIPTQPAATADAQPASIPTGSSHWQDPADRIAATFRHRAHPSSRPPPGD